MKCLPVGALRVLLLSLLVPGVASAQTLNNCITLPGATTIVNPPLVSSAFYYGPHLTISGGAPLPATVIGRQPLNGFAYKPNTFYKKTLDVRFIDNGSDARVQVFLERVDFAGGSETLISFDSNSHPASTAYQMESGVPIVCQLSGNFDTYNNVYSLRVELNKATAAGTPILHSIQVCLKEC